MSSYPYIYNTVTGAIENGIQFLFISKGEVNIVKAVRYVYALDFRGRPVYNLAFGDYDLQTGTLFDDQTSNNGDAYHVFRTVLATVPQFFLSYPDAMLMVWGSDSTKKYQENCRRSCKKNCTTDICKNAHRRITIYRNYINKNLTELSTDYKFYGGSMNNENQIVVEDYKKNRQYPAIIIRKKRRKKQLPLDTHTLTRNNLS